ncbi:MAG: hypothetical protein ACOCRK_11830 [bacterium]
MNIKEFLELYQLIMEKHSRRTMRDNYKNDRKTIKYVDFKIDTRTGNVWCVVFRNPGEIIFRGKNLKEKILNWLKEE